MVEQRFDTLGLQRSSDIERDNRRSRSIGSRWARCFSPCKENETNSDECTSRSSGMAAAEVDKKRMIKKMAQTQDYESSISDNEQEPPHLTAGGSHDDLQWTDRSDNQNMGVESNSRVGSSSRPDVPNCYETSDMSEKESENAMEFGSSHYEDKKDELAKKWSVIVEGGRLSSSRPPVNAMHRVNADLDRYEKGAGVINYKITVRKIMKTDSYRQFSSDLKLPRSLQATSTPKSVARKLSWRSSSWKPSPGKRASYRETLMRESSLSPRRSTERQSLSTSVRFSGKTENANFSPSRGRSPSLLYSNARKEARPLSPRPGRRRFSSPPPRRSRSSGSYQEPLRNARSDSSFRRVTFANDLMGSYKASRMRRQEYADANISGRSESPSRRSVLSNGRRRSQSSNRTYSESQYEEDAESKSINSGKSWNLKNFNSHKAFMTQDVNPSESFTEQMRRVQLEGQEAVDPFSVWDPDSSRWSRDFEKSFDEFMGPNASNFEKDEDTSSGSLFTDEMEVNPRRRLTPREKKLLFHTWNPVFYCNESPGYVRNENIAKKTMIDPRYRVFY